MCNLHIPFVSIFFTYTFPLSILSQNCKKIKSKSFYFSHFFEFFTKNSYFQTWHSSQFSEYRSYFQANPLFFFLFYMISENFLLNEKTNPVSQLYLIQMPCERTAASQPDPYIQKGFICRNKTFLERGRQHRQNAVCLRPIDGIDRILDLLFILRNHHLPGNADPPVVPGTGS